MKLQTITIRNYRRLKKVNIQLDKQTTVFVGSNNSGKTSAAHILSSFLERSSKPSFSIHDFNSECWKQIDALEHSDEEKLIIPSISLDLWFAVEASDVHRVLDLLPSLEWRDKPVGIRIEYKAKKIEDLLANYHLAKHKSAANRTEGFEPWPKSITDYLEKNIKSEFEVEYFVLDREQFDDELIQNEDYEPSPLGSDKERSGKKIIDSLIRVDILHAQRHLGDQKITGRSEDLSRRMNRFYERNLEQKDDDFAALRALANSESELTKHLNSVFDSTLKNLNKLGYPGFANPKLEMRASLNQENIGGQTKLHYSLGDDGLTLPDHYNGLGFKNLIYMVIEILDFHARWADDKEYRAPLHLIIIEEPEAHLHAQIQQVFIRKIWDILKIDADEENFFQSQMIITTHSPHIIYESGFQPIRYFQRVLSDIGNQSTKVLNLSDFYEKSKEKSREFLQRYMKLTHCDLFFADAAILVEGNVERLLLPLMINKAAQGLNKCYLTTIEVGGAYSHIFRKLVDFLGLTTLIITDLDSVIVKDNEASLEEVGTVPEILTDYTSDTSLESEESTTADGAAPEENQDAETSEADDFEQEEVETTDEEDEDNVGNEDEDTDEDVSGACVPETLNAVTSNQTLIKWLPRLTKIEELLDAADESKIQVKTENSALVKVAYQTKTNVNWDGHEQEYAGRTFEESFALENLEWTQNIIQKKLRLRVITHTNRRSLEEIRERLFKRIRSASFNKTDFALGILMKDPGEWNVPSYIIDGLTWLESEIVPVEETEEIVPTIETAIEAEVEVTENTVNDDQESE